MATEEFGRVGGCPWSLEFQSGPVARRIFLGSNSKLQCTVYASYTADIIGRHGVLNSEVSFLEQPYTARSMSQKIHVMFNQRQTRGGVESARLYFSASVTAEHGK